MFMAMSSIRIELAELPKSIKNEFDALLDFEVLAHGFPRLRYGECGHERLLAFTCKHRGF